MFVRCLNHLRIPIEMHSPSFTLTIHFRKPLISSNLSPISITLNIPHVDYLVDAIPFLPILRPL